MIGRSVDWFNSRRWFIRYLLYAEWCLLVTLSALLTEPLSVRVGLNAGEPIQEEGDLFGATVILASRIAAKAEGGEILVADTVRGLCSGGVLVRGPR